MAQMISKTNRIGIYLISVLHFVYTRAVLSVKQIINEVNKYNWQFFIKLVKFYG
jgi:hypothetical protein